MNLQEKLFKKNQEIEKNSILGLYLHVPFCSSTCDFCAFYQKEPKKADVARFLEGVAIEIQGYAGKSPQASTVFWGGGTPGSLPVSALEELGALLQPFIETDAEWTVELAPSLVNPTKLRALKSLGVTRISLGVQSFDDALLRKIGRDHSSTQALRAYEMIRSADFRSVNVDMIFAIPGQSLDDWMQDLNTAIQLSPDHISTYCLTFEEDTALWVKLQEGRFRRDIEQEAVLYTETWRHLEESGLHQYEISNFAREGHACIHNINTWKMHSWIGLGPSAASQINWRRTTNVASLEKWYAGLVKGVLDYSDVTVLDPRMLAIDAIIFGLRMNDGVNIAELEKRFAVKLRQDRLLVAFQQLEEEGLLAMVNDTLHLTPEGRLLADSVGSHLLM